MQTCSLISSCLKRKKPFSALKQKIDDIVEYLIFWPFVFQMNQQTRNLTKSFGIKPSHYFGKTFCC